MAYGSVLTDTVQSSTAATAPVFKDGNGTQIGTLCRAWVNFVGSTGATNASFNVSSVTRSSAGIYNITFTNALTDANFVTVAGAILTTDNAINYGSRTANTTTTTQVRFTNAAAYADPTTVMVSIFR